MSSLKSIWEELQNTFRKELNPQSYEVWIETVKPISFENNQLVIEVPTDVHKTYWKKNLASKIVETSFMLYGKEIIPTFVTPEEYQQLTPVKKPKNQKKSANQMPCSIPSTPLTHLLSGKAIRWLMQQL